MERPADPWRTVWARLRPAALWLGAVVTIGVLLFLYRYLGVLAEGKYEPYLPKLVQEMTGAFAVGVLYFGVSRLVRTRPLTAASWYRALPIYAVALAVFAVIATTSMWGLRILLFPLLGLGHYNYGRMPLRYLMELPIEAISFAFIALAVHAMDSFRAARERELREARLEASLAQAQLRNLRLQLQPHFLFNALNTISSTMYRDPAAADEMISQLAELLRASLRTTQADEVPLAAELEILEQYLAIMRARFGGKLRVDVCADPAVTRARVPSMVLQPLVENAIRHGNAGRAGVGVIQVRARRDGGDVLLEVQDDGPGASGNGPWGVGLTATSERLRLLYGERGVLEAGNLPSGGYLVTARLPFSDGAIEAA